MGPLKPCPRCRSERCDRLTVFRRKSVADVSDGAIALRGAALSVRAAPRIIEIGEGLHAPDFGASSSERWIECMGSVLACRGIKDVPSKYALEGSAAHYVSELVRKGVPLDSLKGVRIRVRHADGYTDVPCNGEMLHSVGTFVDKVAQRPGDKLIEQMVHYDQFVPAGFGTLDDASMDFEIAYSTDFKHGKGVKKDAKMNSQLMLYGVGLTKWSWLYGRFKKFILAISQPRLNHYDEFEISATDLRAWVGDVARPAALRALQPGAPFKAGPWCQFCRIKEDCRVRAAYKAEHQGEATSRSRGNDFGSLD